MRLSDATMNAIARQAAPSLDRAATCRASGNSLSASNDEPELFIDRGPLPEVSESDWAAFEVARTPGKAENWHRQNDQHAKELDMQHLDAMRKEGAL